MKFKIEILVDLSPEEPGLLIPIFKLRGSNLPYAQEMDDSYEVHDMLPYTLADNYQYQLSDENIETDIGEKGIISFRSFDKNIFSGTLSEVLSYRDAYRAEISTAPFLDMQLSRVCAEPVASIFDKWRSVGSTILEHENGRRWADGEMRLYQKNRSIWENINTQQTNKHDTVFANLNDHSFEFLFRWLSNNLNSNIWSKVWLRAFRLNPFDERMSVIARSWLFSRMAENSDLSEIKLILFSYLENINSYSVDYDFSEAFTEYLNFQTDSFFQLLQPHSLPRMVLQSLKFEDYPQTCISFIEYIGARLIGDNRYGDTLIISDILRDEITDYLERNRKSDK